MSYYFINRIVLWFAEQLGVKLNPFIMEDSNTFYLINGVKKRTFAVKSNPDILKYNVRPSEKNKSADQLLQQALQKVRVTFRYKIPKHTRKPAHHPQRILMKLDHLCWTFFTETAFILYHFHFMERHQ